MSTPLLQANYNKKVRKEKERKETKERKKKKKKKKKESNPEDICGRRGINAFKTIWNID